MASTEVDTLNTIGHDIVRSIICVAVETFLIAIYGITVVKASVILRRRGYSRGSTFMLITILLLYLLALILWIIDLVNVVAEARITLVDNPDLDVGTKYDSSQTFINHRQAVQSMLFSYMSVIGDAVIIWRVYAFWHIGREKFVVLLPAVTLLSSVVVSAMLTVCVGKLGGQIELGTFQHPAFCRNIQTSTYATTVATTAVATTLIGIKTWTYRRTVRPVMTSGSALSSRMRVEKILVILIESGMLYLLFFIAQMLLSVSSINEKIFVRADLTFAAIMFDDMTSVIVGMYPTIIVIIIYSQNAYLDTPSHSSGYHSHSSHSNSTGNRAVTFERRVMVSNDTNAVWESSHIGTKGTDIELSDLNGPSSHYLPSMPEESNLKGRRTPQSFIPDARV